jgi:hypothetical protein
MHFPRCHRPWCVLVVQIAVTLSLGIVGLLVIYAARKDGLSDRVAYYIVNTLSIAIGGVIALSVDRWRSDGKRNKGSDH